MIRHHLAYRHGNGEIEGFIGYGFTAGGAQQNAEQAAAEKCTHTPTPFERARLITDAKELSAAEQATVKGHWKLEIAKRKASGASIY